MSDSVQPHGQQPTRLRRPWDSPGKNTGVGCHFLLQCMKVKSEVKSLNRVRHSATPWLQPSRFLHPWDFPGKSTGVGCHCLLHEMDPENDGFWFIELSWAHQLLFIIGFICKVHVKKGSNPNPSDEYEPKLLSPHGLQHCAKWSVNYISFFFTTAKRKSR